MNKVLENLQSKLAKERGYTPTISEVLGEYTDGQLIVTDQEEDALASLL